MAGDLTRVERGIAALAAGGRSNGEIAALRYISVKTVEFHLTRIYRKLGIRSRAQLAAAWPKQRPAFGGLRLPAAMARRSQERFVGRVDERERLRRLLADPSTSRPTALIAGQSGVGKSMLAAGFACDAVARGWGVALMQCQEAALAVLEPFDELAADLCEQTGHVPVSAGVRPARQLAPVVAQIAELHPVVVLAEDLHWADAELLEEFRHLIRWMPATGVLVVTTARRSKAGPGTPLARFFAELRRFTTLETIDLDPFDEGTVRELARATLPSSELGPHTVDDVAAEVFRATGGLPFLVVETLAVLADQGLDGIDASSRLPVGPTVHDFLDHQLASVSHAAMPLLRAGALIGDEFDLDIVSRACSVDRAGAAFTLAGAVADGLLIDVPDRAQLTYRFCHPLIRDAVIEGARPNERAALHVLLARAVHALDETAVERIGHHAGLAGGASEPDEALLWCRAAAESAETAGRYADACRHLHAACAAADRLRPRADELVVALESKLLEVAARAARPDVIDASMARAVTAVRRLGRLELLTDVALAATSLVRMGELVPGVLELTDEALAHTASASDEIALRCERVRLVCASGRQLTDPGDGEVLLERARSTGVQGAIARALRQPSSVLGARRAVHLLGLGRVRDARNVLRRTPTDSTPAADAAAVVELGRLLVDHACGESVVTRADAVAGGVIGPLTAVLPVWVRCDAGDIPGARAQLDALRLGTRPELLADTSTIRWNIALLADVAVALEDEGLATAVYDVGVRHTGRGATFITFFSAGPVDRALGKLAALLGADRDARIHFAAAMAFATRARGLAWRAETLLDWAIASPRTDNARIFAARAGDIARLVGLPRLAGKAASFLDSGGI